MTKIKNLDKIAEKSSPRNRQWFYDYRDYIQNKSGGDNYLSTIRKLYKFYQYKDIHTILASDFTIFLNNVENLLYRNATVEHLKHFFTFLLDVEGVHFNYPIILEINKHRTQKDVLIEEEQRQPIPLSIKEVVALRQLLHKSEKYTLLLIFELVYRYGLKKNELTHIHKKSYDVFTHSFTVNKNVIKVDEDIHELILKLKVLPDSKLTLWTIDYRINEIRKLFREKFLYKDIHQTHKIHFLNCPICHTPTHSSPSLWVVLEYEEDNSQWLVCKSCAMKGEL